MNNGKIEVRRKKNKEEKKKKKKMGRRGGGGGIQNLYQGGISIKPSTSKAADLFTTFPCYCFALSVCLSVCLSLSLCLNLYPFVIKYYHLPLSGIEISQKSMHRNDYLFVFNLENPQ